MTQSMTRSAIFLSLLMVFLPAAGMDFGYGRETSETTPLSTEESDVLLASNKPFSVESFVDDAHFFPTKYPTQVAIGYIHACFLFDDQSLSCSGYNYQGQLGIGEPTPSPYDVRRPQPVALPSDVHVASVAAGWDSTCAIDTASQVWCWGENSGQKLNVQSTSNYVYAPERVEFSNSIQAIEIAVGRNHQCILDASSDIYCWGQNNYGQLGLGNFTSYVRTPMKVEVPGGLVPVSVQTRDDFTCMLTTEQSVYCWGQNSGYLGDGTSADKNRPTQVLLPSSDRTAILSVGYLHSCVLSVNGNTYCWGQNNYGQLGTKSTWSSTSEALVPLQIDVFGDVIDLEVGYEHTCALMLTQTVTCWGLTTTGQLGYGSTSATTDHKSVNLNSYGFSNPTELFAGIHTTCAVFDDGRTGCWGQNNHGQIGDGSVSVRSSPYPNSIQVGSPTSVLTFTNGSSSRHQPFVDGLNFTVQVSPSLAPGLNLDSTTGLVSYDGTSLQGLYAHNLTFVAGSDSVTVPLTLQVVEGNDLSGRVPSYLAGLDFVSSPQSSTLRTLTATKDHTCLTQSDHGMYCWGDGGQKKLGTTSTTDLLTPTEITNTNIRFSPVGSAGQEHTCSLSSDGSLMCWGKYEEIYGSASTSIVSPTQMVSSQLYDLVDLSSQYSHTCYLNIAGDVQCFGKNDAGQLGLGYENSNRGPGHGVDVSFPDQGKAISMGAGFEFSCSLMRNGTVYCWGSNNFGQLGDGTTTDSSTPVEVQLTQSAKAIDLGQSHACALLVNNDLMCWGRNNVGQLGSNTLTDSTVPVRSILPSSSQPVSFDAGTSHTCAALTDGSLHCWGLNSDGQLGDGTTTFRKAPVPSQLPSGFSAVLVAVGESHTCITTNRSTVHCIGSNDQGQLGDGSTTSRNAYGSSIFNNGMISQSWNLVEGYESQISVLAAGWGSIQVQPPNLPAGFSYSGGTLHYDGRSPLTNGTISITATSQGQSVQASILIRVLDLVNEPGVLSSFVSEIGFVSSNSNSFSMPRDITSGVYSGCVVTETGQLRCWGMGTSYQHGIGSTSVRTTPTSVASQIEFRSVESGFYHVCGIDQELNLWCWGRGGTGQIGIGTNSDVAYPTHVNTITEGVLQTSLSGDRTCALTTNRQVYCWGSNSHGEVEQTGSSSWFNLPRHVNKLSNMTVESISAGQDHTCALLNNGTVTCWGRPSEGAMGDNSTSPSPDELRWPHLPAGKRAEAISSGFFHTCALMDDSSVYCWGGNQYGQVGSGTTSNEITPVEVLSSSQNTVGISLENAHSCAWLANGSGMCWGFNQDYRLGIGNNTNMPVPTKVLDHTSTALNDKRILHMDAGFGNSCAMYYDGSVSCWGKSYNGYYGNGDGANSDRSSPVSFVNGFSPRGVSFARSSSIGFVEGYPRSMSLQVVGWGGDVVLNSTLPSALQFNASNGTLWYDGSPIQPSNMVFSITDGFGNRQEVISIASYTISQREGRVQSPLLLNASANGVFSPSSIRAIDLGQDHGCTIHSNEQLRCWGFGANGRLASGSTSNQNSPYLSTSSYAQHPWTQLSLGDRHSCGLDENAHLFCWGVSNLYQNGYDTSERYHPYAHSWSNSPVYGDPIMALSSGGDSTCAIREDLTLWCWGMNNYGQLGHGTTSQGTMPAVVQLPSGITPLAVTVGGNHACALDDAGAVYCWGYNNEGQLGLGNTTQSDSPIQVTLPASTRALAISAGEAHTCAILDDQSITCWGRNTYGQVGDGTTDNRQQPTSVILSGQNDPVMIASGFQSTCALFDDGSLQCWGRNAYGELGIGSTVDSASPQSVLSMSAHDAYDVSLGNGFACAAFHDGSARCWGYNNYGQLGVGDTSSRTSPSLQNGYTGGSNRFSLFAGLEHTIPVHAAGWGYTTSIVSQLPPDAEWNEESMMLVIDKDAPSGNFSVQVHFDNGVNNFTILLDIELMEIIDPWSDRISSHSLGFGVIDDTAIGIPLEIEAGDAATCVMYLDARTQCIGTNSYGETGTGSTTTLSTMTSINTFSGPLRSLSMKDNHACGVDNEFDIWCWGLNSYGGLGVGDQNQRTTPNRLTSDITGQSLGYAFAVETGYGGHTCGIFNRSTYCWGLNNHGQLGDSTTTNRNRPALLSNSQTIEFTDLALGYQHSCGIATNGSVYCWGKNDYGQLGDNSTTESHIPVLVDFQTTVQAVAIGAGRSHVCVLSSVNTVHCWGYNGQGNLGNGPSSAHSSVPVQVPLPSLNSNTIVQLAAGDEFNCALVSNGSAMCWGSNNYDQVEGDLSSDLPSSVRVPTFVNLTENGQLVSLDLGVNHVCGIMKNSDVKCWGQSTGRVPRHSTRVSPSLGFVEHHAAEKLLYPQGWGLVDADISPLPSGFNYTAPLLKVAANASLANALSWSLNTTSGTQQGSLQVDWVQLDIHSGKANRWNNGIEYQTSESSLPMIDVEAGYTHTCGIKTDGSMYCWGSNSYGKLGDGSQSGKLSPTLVRYSDPSIEVVKMGLGEYNTCAITSSGRVFCWGFNNYGQLGVGSKTTPSFSVNPTEVRTPWTSDAVDLSLGHNFACALMAEGTVWCWGDNSFEQLGNPSVSTQSSVPVPVNLPAGRFATSIKSSDWHTCAVLDDGSMHCWGRYSWFNMGDRLSQTAVNVDTPSEVLLPRHLDVVSMDVGKYHGCAYMSDASLWCWGQNEQGQVGVGSVSDGSVGESIKTPVEIDIQNLPPIVDLSANYENTCALHDTGDLTCWGYNNNAQVGDGTTTDAASPTSVFLGSSSASFVSVGHDFACAGTDDGSVNCWGYNNYGQLGTASTQLATYPELINMQAPTFSPVLTFLEGESNQNIAYISGWHYTVDVSPSFPTGFTLDASTGTIYANGDASFGVSRHNITATAGSYSSTVEITLVVIRDSDGDGIADTEDYDDDDDGHLDSLDNCPLDYGTSTSGGYIGCPDGDGDGWADLIDPFVNDDSQWKDSDGDGYGDNPLGNNPDRWVLDASQWFDTDEDGFGDNEFGTRGDSCPTVYGTSTLDIFGCPDTDGDGWSNEGDSFPTIASQFSDRDGDGWGDNQSEGAEQVDAFPSDGTQWEDLDGDGHGDNKYGTEGDWFPDDPTRWADSDRDGYADEDDAFVNDATQWYDRDGDLYGDNPLGNRADTFPDDPNEWLDTDGDGVGNNADAFPFDPTQTSDRDGDGYGDNPLGTGADVFPDNPTQWEDRDGDGLGDNLTGTEADPFLADFDNDGYNDSIDVLPSLYSPGDMDNDGYPDEIDWAPADYREWSDNDGDGEGDNADPDDDNDGWADTDEVRQGTDPYSSVSQPIDSFEIVLPGTAIGLGAWDLIGIFGGVPLFAWIGFGFATRNKRTAKYIEKLKAATTRDELEKVAFQWEYSLMLRLLGPHQGIRLERLRAELDDVFEAQNQKLSSIEPDPYDHTHYVDDTIEVENKELPSIQSHVSESTDVEEETYVQPDNVEHKSEPWPVPDVAEDTVVIESPDSNTPAQTVDEHGYEWYTMDDGTNYYRLSGSLDEWVKFES